MTPSEKVDLSFISPATLKPDSATPVPNQEITWMAPAFQIEGHQRNLKSWTSWRYECRFRSGWSKSWPDLRKEPHAWKPSHVAQLQRFSKDESAKSSSSAMTLFASNRKHLIAADVAKGGPDGYEVRGAKSLFYTWGFGFFFLSINIKKSLL